MSKKKQFQWTTGWVLAVMTFGIIGAFSGHALFRGIALKNESKTPTSSYSTQNSSDATAEYPSAYEANFINACLNTSSGNTSACQCALNMIEANYSHKEAIEMETNGFPQVLIDAIKAQCY